MVVFLSMKLEFKQSLQSNDLIFVWMVYLEDVLSVWFSYSVISIEITNLIASLKRDEISQMRRTKSPERNVEVSTHAHLEAKLAI